MSTPGRPERVRGALEADPDVEAAEEAADAGYARGARILSVGIAATGLFSFAYFSVASHVLDDVSYGGVNLLWTILFITISVIYRPVEQLLSRTIATRRAQGHTSGHPLGRPALIQGTFALIFLIAAIAAHGVLVDAFKGASALWWILVAATLAYAASYFARGFLAGHEWFGLYGGLVLFEAISRFLFPIAVAVGIASGQTAVAIGIAAAPFASLLVIPWALRRHTAAEAPKPDDPGASSGSTSFAVSVAAIQLSEQTLLNAAVLLVPKGATVAIVFSAFLITRAPLQLFQSIQTSLLPHLAGLEATEGREGFMKAIRITMAAVAGFAGIVALGLLALGPWAMGILFDVGHHYARFGLAIIAVGMGFHLASGTLNQAALARGRAKTAAGAWLVAAAAYIVVMAVAGGDPLVRAEVGYAACAALLFVLLWIVELRPAVASAGAEPSVGAAT
jgi:O-antigen/teichoic acid export membrane protein